MEHRTGSNIDDMVPSTKIHPPGAAWSGQVGFHLAQSGQPTPFSEDHLLLIGGLAFRRDRETSVDIRAKQRVSQKIFT